MPDDTAPRGIGGVLAMGYEITEKIIGERRVEALRDLGARTGEARTAEMACAVAAEALTNYARDVPFALLYLIDADGNRARLAGASGVGMDEAASPLVVDLKESSVWPFAAAVRDDTISIVKGLSERFNNVPPGPWSDPPHAAALVPIRSNKAHELAGVMVVGLSPRLRFDHQYRSFLDLAATQVAAAVATARAYEDERKRAEALAEIDRAKTLFFSNVSHEFRTPLTLVLGPMEELKGQLGRNAASAEQYQQIDLAHRNGLRLLKLVNTLLDFSRIEAGRVQATYEPIDLAATTAELASVFRSAIEQAGLRLVVSCEPLSEAAWVDREMWEKIVLNLLSNALKFTFDGKIEMSLRLTNEHFILAVSDTGTGIPAHELPRLFERFHRVVGAHGRTHEGSGIGLALVQELVKLHGGTVDVESEPGRGSTFTVAIPQGCGHLPAAQIGAPRNIVSTALGTNVFVEEALRWLPESGPEDDAIIADIDVLPAEEISGGRRSILLADDNADMSDYVRRLLAQRYVTIAWTVEDQVLGFALGGTGRTAFAGAHEARLRYGAYRAKRKRRGRRCADAGHCEWGGMGNYTAVAATSRSEPNKRAVRFGTGLYTGGSDVAANDTKSACRKKLPYCRGRTARCPRSCRGTAGSGSRSGCLYGLGGTGPRHHQKPASGCGTARWKSERATC